MQFRIADTFTHSLARLSGDEQRAAKTTAFDLQLNPGAPGLSFHKLDHARDKNFWSVRVNSDIRLIVHRTADSLLLCYVDHHDKAYSWAERRKLETHPSTGAAQLVEIRETVQEIVVPVYVETVREVERPVPAFAGPLLFDKLSDAELLGYGVPAEWLADVRAANETALFALIDHLPAEAAEALMELAVGGRPRPAQPVATGADPFEHPDALRRFRAVGNVEELQRALDAPWEKWAVFLHPDQRQLVERAYNGPARVSGSAGTGKTVVALHRAVFLARSNPDARILLATFSDVLANALRNKLFLLVQHEPRLAERIDVSSIDAIALRLYEAHFGAAKLASRETVAGLLNEAAETTSPGQFTPRFLLAEWEQVCDAWQVEIWEKYRDVARLGRRTRLPEGRRAQLWTIFETVRNRLKEQGLLTWAGLYGVLAAQIPTRKNPPFEFAVIDEIQDISVAQLRFLNALGSFRPDALFFAGDLGQRIFQQPFSWLALGVDVRGRCRTLKVNYRTSHQIRTDADKLLAPEVTDVDGNIEQRKGTISVFNGPAPEVLTFEDEDKEAEYVAEWIRTRANTLPHEVGVFVRSKAELPRAIAAVELAELKANILDEEVTETAGRVAVGTMHLAKGLEFKAVVVMACDDEVVPLQSRIETATDESDLKEVYDTERHLLYVACTRARDALLVTAVGPGSEFLEDLVS